MKTIHDVLSHDPMGELEFVSRETFLIDPWLCGVDCSNHTCVDDDLYSIGCLPSRFQLPATEGNADLATSYRWICGHCPNAVPCRVCIDEYMDAMEYHLEIDYGY